MSHKAGFVNIVGNPNVGKSTLMNAMVGEKLSIITSKAQTTRHRIMGIVNHEDYQIVYSDTPGVLKPAYKLQETMLRAANSALSDADLLLYITDVYEKTDKNEEFLNKIKASEVPVVLVINKIDMIDQEKLDVIFEQWREVLPEATIFPASALHNFNLDLILKRILEILPECPPYFDKEQLTDKPMRFFASEIIREKILLYYQKEVPYSTHVVIEEYRESSDPIFIRGIIYVARDSQKGIIIGNKGAAIKKLGTEARRSIESFLDAKVYLELMVKVDKDWRDRDSVLRQFGYEV